ncbi:g2959 [Coccomyxa viridis]|uniref:G2959 protein n=1 Tax=Coccomyxa viridis TaxID=1274662 RepID=A0ABP1FRV0_9CHLO
MASYLRSQRGTYTHGYGPRLWAGTLTPRSAAQSLFQARCTAKTGRDAGQGRGSGQVSQQQATNDIAGKKKGGADAAEASRAEKSPNKVDAVELSPSRMELRRLGVPGYGDPEPSSMTVLNGWVGRDGRPE